MAVAKTSCHTSTSFICFGESNVHSLYAPGVSENCTGTPPAFLIISEITKAEFTACRSKLPS